MIQKKEVFKKIGGIIVEISEQYQYLSQNLDKLNDLELELFAANADFLSEHVKVLRKVNSAEVSIQQNLVDEKKTVAPSRAIVENVFKEPQPEPAPIPVPIHAGDLFSSNHSENISESIPAELNEPEEAFAKLEIQDQSLAGESVPVVHLETEDEIIPTIEIVSEPVKEEGLASESISAPQNPAGSSSDNVPAPTLNDIISAQKAQSIQTNSPFTAQPITDLKTSISLNDKLLFIKDLFNGYSLAYSEAIEILNRFDSFEVAETFLKTNYAGKNNWSSKLDSVDKFYEILHRRYSK